MKNTTPKESALEIAKEALKTISYDLELKAGKMPSADFWRSIVRGRAERAKKALADIEQAEKECGGRTGYACSPCKSRGYIYCQHQCAEECGKGEGEAPQLANALLDLDRDRSALMKERNVLNEKLRIAAEALEDIRYEIDFNMQANDADKIGNVWKKVDDAFTRLRSSLPDPFPSDGKSPSVPGGSGKGESHALEIAKKALREINMWQVIHGERPDPYVIDRSFSALQDIAEAEKEKIGKRGQYLPSDQKIVDRCSGERGDYLPRDKEILEECGKVTPKSLYDFDSSYDRHMKQGGHMNVYETDESIVLKPSKYHPLARRDCTCIKECVCKPKAQEGKHGEDICISGGKGEGVEYIHINGYENCKCSVCKSKKAQKEIKFPETKAKNGWYGQHEPCNLCGKSGLHYCDEKFVKVCVGYATEGKGICNPPCHLCEKLRAKEEKCEHKRMTEDQIIHDQKCPDCGKRPYWEGRCTCDFTEGSSFCDFCTKRLNRVRVTEKGVMTMCAEDADKWEKLDRQCAESINRVIDIIEKWKDEAHGWREEMIDMFERWVPRKSKKAEELFLSDIEALRKKFL